MTSCWRPSVKRKESLSSKSEIDKNIEMPSLPSVACNDDNNSFSVSDHVIPPALAYIILWTWSRYPSCIGLYNIVNL